MFLESSAFRLTLLCSSPLLFSVLLMIDLQTLSKQLAWVSLGFVLLSLCQPLLGRATLVGGFASFFRVVSVNNCYSEILRNSFLPLYVRRQRVIIHFPKCELWRIDFDSSINKNREHTQSSFSWLKLEILRFRFHLPLPHTDIQSWIIFLNN